MIARLICKVFGHKRGKLTSLIGGVRTIGCPRCKATWARKVKA
jgi:hypothetical protein